MKFTVAIPLLGSLPSLAYARVGVREIMDEDLDDVEWQNDPLLFHETPCHGNGTEMLTLDGVVLADEDYTNRTSFGSRALEVDDFDWMVDDLYDFYAQSQERVTARLPHFDISEHYEDAKAIDPKSGWRLLRRDFGSLDGPRPKYPFFALYNPQMGMIRLYYLPVGEGNDYSFHRVALGYQSSNAGDINSACTYSSDRSFASDFDAGARESVLIECATENWCSADLLTNYDPKKTGEDVQLQLIIHGVDISEVRLEGNVSLSGSIGTESVSETPLHEKLWSGVTEAIDVGVQVHLAQEKIVKLHEANPGKWYSSALGGLISAFKLSGGNPWITVVGGAAGLFLGYVGSTSESEQATAIQLEGTLELEGEIIKVKPLDEIGMLVPGSANLSSSNHDHMPSYNLPLGVIGLAKRPKFIWNHEVADTNSISCHSKAFYDLQEPLVVYANSQAVEIVDVKVSLVFDWRAPLGWKSVWSFNNHHTTGKGFVVPDKKTSSPHPRLAVKVLVKNPVAGQEDIVILRTYRPNFEFDQLATPPGSARIFEHIHYKGKALTMERDETFPKICRYWRVFRCGTATSIHHSCLRFLWNDRASSLAVGKDTWVTLYQHYHLGGDKITFDIDHAELTKTGWSSNPMDWNDRASGLVAEKATYRAKTCRWSKYRGDCHYLPLGRAVAVNGNSMLIGPRVKVEFVWRCVSPSGVATTKTEVWTESLPSIKHQKNSNGDVCGLQTAKKKYVWQN